MRSLLLMAHAECARVAEDAYLWCEGLQNGLGTQEWTWRSHVSLHALLSIRRVTQNASSIRPVRYSGETDWLLHCSSSEVRIRRAADEDISEMRLGQLGHMRWKEVTWLWAKTRTSSLVG